MTHDQAREISIRVLRGIRAVDSWFVDVSPSSALEAAAVLEALLSREPQANVEEKKASKANDPRAAFDVGFTLGAAFGCAINGHDEAEAARRLERVPTAATCDEFWAKWQADVVEAEKKEEPPSG